MNQEAYQMSQLQQVFSVDVQHSYFKDQVCRCITIVPMAATGALLSRENLALKSNGGGLICYNASKKQTSDLLESLKEATGDGYLEFELVISDPDFHKFTELWNRAGNLDYDTRITSASTNGCVLLHETSNGTGNHLRIHVEELLNNMENGNANRFRIVLRAAATQWRYLICGPGALLLSDPQVGNAQFSFKNEGQAVLENGATALVFSSRNRMIPCSEEPSGNFSLTVAEEGKPRKTIMKLPDADARSGSSDVFVYL